MIRYQCECGQQYNFGGSFGGRRERCRNCFVEFIVPFDPADEAMRRLEQCVVPMGTDRGLVCGQLRRYGQSPKRSDHYFDRRTNKHYEKCAWDDLTVWLDADVRDALEQSSKGKRKPFAVTPPIVEPPDEQYLVHVGTIGACV